MRTLVINPVGEPGVGKSTFSFWLTAALKLRGVSAEYVPEVIKTEFYSPEGLARVSGGAFDKRTLCRQHGFIRPLLGRAEVVVNDGTLPVFFHYWSQRLTPERLVPLRALLDRYMGDQSVAEHHYVLLSRDHAYEAVGRFKDAASAPKIRAGLLETLSREFDIHPAALGAGPAREAYADALAAQIIARRAPSVRPARP